MLRAVGSSDNSSGGKTRRSGRGAGQGRNSGGGGSSGSTWNPADKSANITLSGGNLIATVASGSGSVRGTRGRNSGVYYFEVTCGGGVTDYQIGVANAAHSINVSPGSDNKGIGYANNGRIYCPGYGVITIATYASGDVIGVKYDAGTGQVTFYKNGAAVGGPYTPTIVFSTDLIYPMFGRAGALTGQTATLNTAGSFVALPAGATAWG